MKYLIKSLYHTKSNKAVTWYGPERNGYTTFICNAGIYIEDDKDKMQGLIYEKAIEFVPVTDKIINKGIKQLSIIKKKKEEYLTELQKEIAIIETKKNELLKLKNSMES